MVIEIQDGDKVKRYTLKPFDQWTVADWRKVGKVELKDPKGERENLVEIGKALCGIPKAHLRRMPIGELSRFIDSVAEFVVNVAAVKEAEANPPRSFVLDGITYICPQSIERDTVFGQYEDLENVLLPKAETEADIYAAIAAALCIPEGEAYDGGKVMDRLAKFEELPILTAMTLHAFFFENSEQYRNAMASCIRSYLISKLPKEEPTPQP